MKYGWHGMTWGQLQAVNTTRKHRESKCCSAQRDFVIWMMVGSSEVCAWLCCVQWHRNNHFDKGLFQTGRSLGNSLGQAASPSVQSQ